MRKQRREEKAGFASNQTSTSNLATIIKNKNNKIIKKATTKRERERTREVRWRVEVEERQCAKERKNEVRERINIKFYNLLQ